MSNRKDELSPEQRKQLREDHMWDVRFHEPGASVIITKFDFTLNEMGQLMSMTPIEQPVKEAIKAECFAERDEKEWARIEKKREKRSAQSGSEKPRKKKVPASCVGFHRPSCDEGNLTGAPRPANK